MTVFAIVSKGQFAGQSPICRSKSGIVRGANTYNARLPLKQHLSSLEIMSHNEPHPICRATHTHTCSDASRVSQPREASAQRSTCANVRHDRENARKALREAVPASRTCNRFQPCAQRLLAGKQISMKRQPHLRSIPVQQKRLITSLQSNAHCHVHTHTWFSDARATRRVLPSSRGRAPDTRAGARTQSPSCACQARLRNAPRSDAKARSACVPSAARRRAPWAAATYLRDRARLSLTDGCERPTPR